MRAKVPEEVVSLVRYGAQDEATANVYPQAAPKRNVVEYHPRAESN